MRIGNIIIKKAYLGNKQLSPSNAFLGTVPVIEGEKEYDYAAFTSLQDGSTISYTYSTQPILANVEILYSFDKTNWNRLEEPITLNTGEKIYVKGVNNKLSTQSYYTNFNITGKVEGSGSIMSLIDGKGEATYCPKINNIFEGCTGLVKAPRFTATKVAYQAYYNAFDGCTQLEEVEILARSIDASYGTYYYLNNALRGCTSLKWVRVDYFGETRVNFLPDGYEGIFVYNLKTHNSSEKLEIPSTWNVIYYDEVNDKYYLEREKKTECDKYGNPLEPQTTFGFDTDYFTADFGRGTYPFLISSKVHWTASVVEEGDWSDGYTITPMEGDGNGTMSIEVPSNKFGDDERFLNITLTSDIGETSTLRFKQEIY